MMQWFRFLNLFDLSAVDKYGLVGLELIKVFLVVDLE